MHSAASLVFALLVTVQAAPSQAAMATFAEQPELAVAGQNPAREKKICKRAVATGSIMQKTTCRTAGEWKEAAAKAAADLEQLRNNGQASVGPGED